MKNTSASFPSEYLLLSLSPWHWLLAWISLINSIVGTFGVSRANCSCYVVVFCIIILAMEKKKNQNTYNFFICTTHQSHKFSHKVVKVFSFENKNQSLFQFFPQEAICFINHIRLFFLIKICWPNWIFRRKWSNSNSKVQELMCFVA